MNNGITLMKGENGTWNLIVSRLLTSEEFESCMRKLLSSDTMPQQVMAAGQLWTFADLSNRQARMLLYESIGGANDRTRTSGQSRPSQI